MSSRITLIKILYACKNSKINIRSRGCFLLEISFDSSLVNRRSGFLFLICYRNSSTFCSNSMSKVKYRMSRIEEVQCHQRAKNLHRLHQKNRVKETKVKESEEERYENESRCQFPSPLIFRFSSRHQ
jgi:hypothetical protein